MTTVRACCCANFCKLDLGFVKGNLSRSPPSLFVTAFLLAIFLRRSLPYSYLSLTLHMLSVFITPSTFPLTLPPLHSQFFTHLYSHHNIIIYLIMYVCLVCECVCLCVCGVGIHVCLYIMYVCMCVGGGGGGLGSVFEDMCGRFNCIPGASLSCFCIINFLRIFD